MTILRNFRRSVSARRALSCLVLGSVLGTVAAVPSGSAAELDDRRRTVEQRIDEAEHDLDQSSAELAAVEQRLSDAVAALGGARENLAHTRAELASAQALDDRLEVELSEAVTQLRQARSAIAAGRASVARREDDVRALVVDQYASGGSDIMALSTVLNTQDTTRLTGRLASRDTVLDVQAATLDRLAASQAVLAVQEGNLEAAKRQVAAQRAAAAANLTEKARLEAEAEAAAGRITSLVAQHSDAQQAAAHARTEDAREVGQLQEEKAEIAALLRRRAEQARAEAAARAREAAAAAAAAAAAEQEATDQRDPAPLPAPQPAPQPAPPPAPTPSGSVLGYPVDGYLTSPFGMRFHPIYQVWKLHDGTDFGASCGTPVRAAASGTVIAAYYGGGYGNRIIVDHGLREGVGLGTTYNHLSGYATSVGDHVERGEVIGYVGTTGASTGCHLHFMVFRNGVTVDPMAWL